MKPSNEPELDERTRRLLDHALKQMAKNREELGHLPPLEYMVAVNGRREQENVELERLIDSGYFDAPEPPEGA